MSSATNSLKKNIFDPVGNVIDSSLGWALNPGLKVGEQLGLDYDSLSGNKAARQAQEEAASAQRAQEAEQQRLLEEQQSAIDLQRQQDLVAENRIAQEAMYAIQDSQTQGTILTGGLGKIDESSLKKKGYKTLLGDWDEYF